MKTTAMIINEYTENTKFKKEELELPKLGDTQVLIEVKATSINPVDHMVLKGMVAIGPEGKTALHGDVSGVVVEVGANVKNFNNGDQVYGIAGGLVGHGGATSNHMIVNEDLIAQKPKTFSFNEAASLPLVFVTAYEGLVDKVNIQKGQELLVIGGTGGVGHQVIQLAKILGAKVTATASGKEKCEIAKSFGADTVIDRNEVEVNDYAKTAGLKEGFDIVFDTVGGENLNNIWETVKPNGDIVTTVGMGNFDLTPMHMKGLSLHVVFMLLPMLTGQGEKRHQDILNYLAEKIDEGKIKTLMNEKVYSLEEVNEAHEAFANQNYLGKIVIDNSKGLQ